MRVRFRQDDLKRALKGAKAAGVEPEEARILPTGEIRLMLRSSDAPSSTAREVCEELADWARHEQ